MHSSSFHCTSISLFKHSWKLSSFQLSFKFHSLRETFLMNNLLMHFTMESHQNVDWKSRPSAFHVWCGRRAADNWTDFSFIHKLLLWIFSSSEEEREKFSEHFMKWSMAALGKREKRISLFLKRRINRMSSRRIGIEKCFRAFDTDDYPHVKAFLRVMCVLF